MNKFFVVLFILCMTIVGWPAFAQKRSVSFEWEPIQGAKSYEVLITKVKKDADSKDFTFKSVEPIFNGSLTPGNYKMKLRSIDSRGVPGSWSPDSDFLVPLGSVKLISPTPKASFAAKSKEEEITFKWKEVAGADHYLFEIVSSDEKIKLEEKIKSTEVEKSLLPGTYTWKVKAANSQGLESESTSIAEMSIQGSKLEKPVVSVPETEFVRELKWTRPESAENFDYALARYNPQTKKWDKVQSVQGQDSESLPFDEKWTGGKYKFSIRAKASARTNSDVATIVFPVRTGDRSPAAEYVTTVRQSIDRIKGWYGIASYLITQINYSVNYLGSPKGLSFPAIGGTGRLGAGWFGENNPWGFLAIVDFSGFLKDNKPSTFSSMELSAIYRYNTSDRGELRFQSGLFFKEFPQVLPIPATVGGSNDSVVKKYSALGPHLGAEYWYSLTSKVGLQAHAHLYYSLQKVSVPNGGTHSPQLSTQYGLLGSYRLSKRMTGLAGITVREDKSSYNDETELIEASKNSLINASSSQITSSFQGTYFNLFAEYSF